METETFAVINSPKKAITKTPELRTMALIDLQHPEDSEANIRKELKRRELIMSFLKFLDNSVTERILERTNPQGYRLGTWIRENQHLLYKCEATIGRRIENIGFCFLEVRGGDLNPSLYTWKPSPSFDDGFSILALRHNSDWFKATPEEIMSLWNALLIVKGVMFGDE